MEDAIVLRYVGDGRYYTGVPRRDLTAADVADLPAPWTPALLVASGLYAPPAGAAVPEAPRPPKPKVPLGTRPASG